MLVLIRTFLIVKKIDCLLLSLWLHPIDFCLICSQEEQNTFPLSTLIEVVSTQRSFGNRCFNQSRYYNAKDHYKEVQLLCSVLWEFLIFLIFYSILPLLGPQAMKLLGNRETHISAEKEEIQTALLPLYLNLSLTELRLERPKKALKYANKALEIDSANTKALFRSGQVRWDFCLFFSPNIR